MRDFARLIEIYKIHRTINKNRRVKLVKKNVSSVKYKLMFKLKWTDIHHVCNLILEIMKRAFPNIKIFKIKQFANFLNLL